MDWIKAALRKVKIATRTASLLVSLISFAVRLSKAMKIEDLEERKNSILEAVARLIESLPYDLPGLLRLEFEKENGGET